MNTKAKSKTTEPVDALLAEIKIERTIVLMDVDKVKVYERNAKKHTRWQIQAVAKAIQTFGFNVPLILDGKNEIIAGHCRLESAKMLGLTHVPCIVKTDLNAEKVKAYRLLDNKLNESMWDRAMAAEDVREMGVEGVGLLEIGYDDSEIRELMGDIKTAGLTDDDAIPDVPKKAKSSLGDIYLLGDHRLMCGDSTEGAHVIKLMDGVKADLVFTDPPYNVDYEGYTDDNLKIQNDKMSDDEFRKFLHAAFLSYRAASKDGVAVYVCHPDWFQREFQTGLEAAGFAVRTTIVWVKNTFGWGFSRYKFQHEGVLYAHVQGEKDPWYGDKTQSTVWEENKPTANRLHPTMKPVELVMRAITNSSKSGDVVLDLFGGSGSTMIASEKMKRRAYLMELDPKYVDVIVQRWEEFTGKKARLVTRTSSEKIPRK